jgi:hypothetical protein
MWLMFCCFDFDKFVPTILSVTLASIEAKRRLFVKQRTAEPVELLEDGM